MRAYIDNILFICLCRSQLAIGVSRVLRDLEKRLLACVLVSGHATPAISVNHVIALARQHGCPLLCLDELSTTVAKATASKVTPLAIGFKVLFIFYYNIKLLLICL